MAYEIPGFSFTLKASSNVINKQFRFVSIDTSGEATFPVDGGPVVGVMTNKPTAVGQAATVVHDGIVKVEATESDTLGLGDTVQSSTVGGAVIHSTGNIAVGKVVDGSSGSTGRILSVLLTGLTASTSLD